MNLKAFIRKHGDKAAAQVLGVSWRTAKSWRLGEREPSISQARYMIEVMAFHVDGPFTFNSIYGTESGKIERPDKSGG